MNETILAKMISGEIVVGKTSDENPDYIEETFLVDFKPSEDGRVGIQLLPYMYPFEQKGATLEFVDTIYTCECPAELEKAYIEASSGIIMSSTPPEPKEPKPTLKLVK